MKNSGGKASFLTDCDMSCPKGRLPKSIWNKITPADHTSTLLLITGGMSATSKHSGGRYLSHLKHMRTLGMLGIKKKEWRWNGKMIDQYVPAPCDVSSISRLSSSMILDSPKSVILISPLWIRMFPGCCGKKHKCRHNHNNGRSSEQQWN